MLNGFIQMQYRILSLGYNGSRKSRILLYYDDGKFTYIVLDRTVLQTAMPTVFIGSRKIVNTQVHKNIIVINQLIEKATLRLGKQKVTIQKKRTRPVTENTNQSQNNSNRQTNPIIQ